jgi:glucose/arabinose dehydrogenase
MLTSRATGRRRRTAPRSLGATALGVLVLASSCGGSGSATSGGPPPEGPPPAGTADTSPNRASLANVRVTLEPVATLPGRAITALSPRPGGTDLYVTEQAGRVRRLASDGQGGFRVDDDAVIDLADETAAGGERGMLGLAFSPDGETLYLYYTATDGAITVDALAVTGTRADRSSRRNLLRLDHPRSNHNGGQLALGPDGYLYIGTGDGGGGGDPDRNGQDPRTLLGKILRIDPATPADSKPYSIPPGNPFADGTEGAPEVWAFGLRNPWRFSFDRQTGDLWIGDVGQDEIEEIDFAANGARGAGPGHNYGWRAMEGNQPFEGGSAPADHVPPIYDYSHADGGCSVIGGYVSRRGDPLLDGVYLFADICIGRINGLIQRDGRVLDTRHLGATAAENTISSFGEGADGTLYAVQLDGTISRVEPGAT